jgi:predicted small secreted protein
MRGAAVALAVAAAATSLAACSADSIPGVNSDDSDTARGKKAKAIVERFAEADGPEACDMLTPAALRNVYGKDEPPGPAPEIDQPPPPISLAECRKRSARFSGDEIDVEKVDVVGEDKRAARVEVNANDERTFTVTVRQKGDAWLIDEIREK